jgi:YcaO-like protein with predicted kinase domain
MMVGADPAVAPATEPLWVRGTPHRAVKAFWHGTQRSIAPEETLQRILPYFQSVGLTRLADITGLDRLAIPVVLSVRPNAGYLALDAGKGFTLTAAKVSAAMECLERHHAETAELTIIRESYVELSRRHPVVPLELLPLARDSLFNPRLPERWALGWDLVQSTEVAVPAAMVPMERFRYGRDDLVSFQTGSNGLASGNHLLEAIESALLELIERDAVTSHLLALQSYGHIPPKVRLETISSPLVRELLDRFEAAGVEPILFDCTVDTGVPVFMAYLFDRLVRDIGLYRGYGAHLDPSIAMVRALTEAAQGRLVFIAGSRDDMYRRPFHRLKLADSHAAATHFGAAPAVVDAGEIQSRATATFEGDAAYLLQRLRAVGLQNAVVFDLSRPGEPFAVVRAVAPGLEGYMFDYYSPGPRARAFLERIQA